MLPETARRIVKTLSATPKKKIPNTVLIIEKALHRYQRRQ